MKSGPESLVEVNTTGEGSVLLTVITDDGTESVELSIDQSRALVKRLLQFAAKAAIEKNRQLTS
jgi:hypothetical protein